MADFCKFYQSEIALTGEKTTSSYLLKSQACETLTAGGCACSARVGESKNAKNKFLCLICFCNFPTYNVTEKIGSGASAIGSAPKQINNCQTIDWFCGKSQFCHALDQFAYHNNNRAGFAMHKQKKLAKTGYFKLGKAEFASLGNESSLLISEVFIR